MLQGMHFKKPCIITEYRYYMINTVKIRCSGVKYYVNLAFGYS